MSFWCHVIGHKPKKRCNHTYDIWMSEPRACHGSIKIAVWGHCLRCGTKYVPFGNIKLTNEMLTKFQKLDKLIIQ